MAQQAELQAILEEVIGSRNVYFQPPPSIKMVYPCIVYKRDRVQALHANNDLYFRKKSYMVTVIDRNPNSPIPDNVARLPLCAFSRHFQADNLNHDVFTLYF